MALWTVACQAPLSMGFSRQEYWSRLPCPPPEDLPDPGIEPSSLTSPAWQADSLPPVPPGKPDKWVVLTIPLCLFIQHMLKHKLESIGRMQGCLIGHQEGNTPRSLKGLDPELGPNGLLSLAFDPLSAHQLTLPLCVQGRNNHASINST